MQKVADTFKTATKKVIQKSSMEKGDLITYKITGIASSKLKSSADARTDTADKSGKSFRIPKRIPAEKQQIVKLRLV